MPDAPSTPAVIPATEDQATRMAAGAEAANELARLEPELHAGILAQLRRVEEEMNSNGGILAPELAVQAWYAVMAENKVAQRLGNAMKAGGQAAQSRRREARSAAARSASS